MMLLLLPASAPRFLGNTGHNNVNILLIELVLVLSTVVPIPVAARSKA